MTTKNRGRSIGVALALCAAGVPASIYFVKSEGPKRSTDNETRRAVPQQAKTPAISARTAGEEASPWRVGTELGYSVDFASTLEAVGGEAHQADDERSLSLTGSAKLTLTAVRVDEKRLVLAGRITELAIAVGNDKAAEHGLAKSLTEGIERPFRLTLSSSGHIEELAVHRDVRGMPHGILRNIVAALQFVRPDSPGKAEWQAVESDANGVFKARYQTVDPRRFTKTKLEYTMLEITERLQVGNQRFEPKVDAKADFELDANGHIRRVAAQEKLLLPLGDEGFKTQTHVTLALEVVGRGRVEDLWDANLLAGELWQIRAPARARAEIADKQALVAGATFSELASKLEGLRSREAGSERMDLMARMSALLDLDPKSIDELTARLRAVSSKEDQELLLGALSDSSLPEAQSALAELARDASLDEKVRSDAVSHLGLQERPTAETFEALEALAGDSTAGLEGPATLALGGAARRAAEAGEEPEAAERAVSTLVRKASSATTPQAQRTAIDALGNSGSTEALPAIRNALASPSPDIRAAAVSALRHIPGEEAERLVAQTLRTDDADFVRGTAANTVGRREFTPFSREAVVGALGADEAESVRIALVDVVGAWLELEPTLRAVLETAAANDASEEVRKMAARLLSGRSSTGG